jgi:Holliday junction DNA helicase RuvB
MLRRKNRRGNSAPARSSIRDTDTPFRYVPPWEQATVEWKAPADNQYRPSSLDYFIGQERHIRRLRIAITSAKKQSKPLPHMAFISPPGMGKTTLAFLVAKEMGGGFIPTTGSAMRSMPEIYKKIQGLRGGVLFVDEAHDLARARDFPVVSALLPLLEDFVCYMPQGRLAVQPFTVILATTHYGQLDSALRSRMGIPYDLDPYEITHLSAIVINLQSKLNCAIDAEAAEMIAVRSRGQPRTAVNITRECHNYAVAMGTGRVAKDEVISTCKLLRIDQYGLTEDDRRILELLSNGPVSLSGCASYLSMDRKTFENVIEDFLFRQGYITRNSKGRDITEKGMEVLARVINYGEESDADPTDF